jgi:hypothetical protein
MVKIQTLCRAPVHQIGHDAGDDVEPGKGGFSTSMPTFSRALAAATGPRAGGLVTIVRGTLSVLSWSSAGSGCFARFHRHDQGGTQRGSGRQFVRKSLRGRQIGSVVETAAKLNWPEPGGITPPFASGGFRMGRDTSTPGPAGHQPGRPSTRGRAIVHLFYCSQRCCSPRYGQRCEATAERRVVRHAQRQGQAGW